MDWIAFSRKPDAVILRSRCDDCSSFGAKADRTMDSLLNSRILTPSSIEMMQSSNSKLTDGVISLLELTTWWMTSLALVRSEMLMSIGTRSSQWIVTSIDEQFMARGQFVRWTPGAVKCGRKHFQIPHRVLLPHSTAATSLLLYLLHCCTNEQWMNDQWLNEETQPVGRGTRAGDAGPGPGPRPGPGTGVAWCATFPGIKNWNHARFSIRFRYSVFD